MNLAERGQDKSGRKRVPGKAAWQQAFSTLPGWLMPASYWLLLIVPIPVRRPVPARKGRGVHQGRLTRTRARGLPLAYRPVRCGSRLALLRRWSLCPGRQKRERWRAELRSQKTGSARCSDSLVLDTREPGSPILAGAGVFLVCLSSYLPLRGPASPRQPPKSVRQAPSHVQPPVHPSWRRAPQRPCRPNTNVCANQERFTRPRSTGQRAQRARASSAADPPFP